MERADGCSVGQMDVVVGGAGSVEWAYFQDAFK